MIFHVGRQSENLKRNCFEQTEMKMFQGFICIYFYFSSIQPLKLLEL